MKDFYYYLGLIAADGYLQKNKRHVGLDLTDKDIVYSMADYFSCHEPRCYGDGRNLPRYRVLISDDKLCNAVLDYGLRTKLKKGMEFPPVPAKYMSHFIRGYFDGDGSFMHDVVSGIYPRVRVNIRGPLAFLIGMRDTLGYGKVYGGVRCGTLVIHSKAEVKKFTDYIYNDCITYIKSKYDRVPRT